MAGAYIRGTLGVYRAQLKSPDGNSPPVIVLDQRIQKWNLP